MGKDNFFSGFLWKFFEQVMSQIVSFFISIILARLLTPHDYGEVALVNVFIIIASVFVTSGFSTSLIQKKGADDLDFSTIFYCSLIFSFLLYLVIYVSAPLISNFYYNKDLIPVIRVLGFVLPILAINSIQQAYVARSLAFKKIFFSTTFATIASGIIGIILAINNFKVWALVYQYLVNNVLSAFVLFVQIPWRPKFHFSINRAKSFMAYGGKVMVADFLGNFFAQLRSLVIGRFYTPADLAFYNRGQQFPNLLSNNVDTTISSVLFPYMSQSADDPQKLKSIARRALRISSFLIMPLMFGLMVTAKPLILLLLTKKWVKAVQFMQWLCVANAFSTITNANLQIMKASGRSDLLLKIELLKKPVYIVLLFISIKINILSVAITMTIYSVYAAIVNAKPNKKIIGYSYKEQISRSAQSLLLSLRMALIIWGLDRLPISLSLILIIQISLGIFIYVLGAYFFHLDSLKYLVNFILKKFKRLNH